MATTKWVIDPTHSEIGFKVKHLMFSNVSGKFDKFEATVESDGDEFSNSKIELSIDAASINTNDASRDGHVRSAEFFDAETFPKLKFTATKFQKAADGNYELIGDLTIKDVTKAVHLAAEFGGIAKDPWGNIKSAFTVTGKINRKDWGLNWNAALETGGVLLSEEVRINCEVQLLKQVEVAVA
jgi:polyisoprenoid-binding protein YceI